MVARLILVQKILVRIHAGKLSFERQTTFALDMAFVLDPSMMGKGELCLFKDMSLFSAQIFILGELANMVYAAD